MKTEEEIRSELKKLKKFQKKHFLEMDHEERLWEQSKLNTLKWVLGDSKEPQKKKRTVQADGITQTTTPEFSLGTRRNNMTFELTLDPAEFKKQRMFLMWVVMNLDRTNTSQASKEAIEGLLGLTDEIADQAHDKYGLDVLLESSED
jgi:hypothetical protein